MDRCRQPRRARKLSHKQAFAWHDDLDFGMIRGQESLGGASAPACEATRSAPSEFVRPRREQTGYSAWRTSRVVGGGELASLVSPGARRKQTGSDHRYRP